MNKVVLVFTGIAAVVVILLFLSRFPYSSTHEGFSQDNIKGVSQDIERTYPSKIKLLYVNLLSMHGPLSESEANMVLNENLLVKRVFVNTYHLDDGYEYENGKFTQNPDVRDNNIKELLAARKSNLSIRMASTWHLPIEGMGFKDLNEVKGFLKRYADVLVDEARFGEEYGVEYFEMSEPDHIILSQQFPVNEDDIAKTVNEFKEYAVPKIRRVYAGRIEYQIGDAGEWDFTKLNVSGLDQFGVLIGGMCDFKMFKDKVDEIFSRAEHLSESSGVPWVISELWINKKYDECDLTGKRNKYYEYVFEKAKSSTGLKGIMIDTWNVDERGFETSIKDTGTEQVIKEFFDKWN